MLLRGEIGFFLYRVPMVEPERRRELFDFIEKLFMVARKQVREIEPIPETRESMKEDVQWARQQMS